MMTHDPSQVVSENKVSSYDYVHHMAAEDPNKFSQTRLAQQQSVLKKYKEELQVIENTKLYAKRSAESEAICHLFAGMDLFCKRLTKLPKQKPKRASSAAAAGQNSKNAAGKLGHEHWLKVYDYRMNEKGYVLRS